MNIRKAELKDKNAILEVTNELRLENIPDFVWNKENFVDNQILNGEYFLYETGGKVVGIISLRKRRDKMFIETLAVRKDHRRGGVGEKLINFAKQFSKERGVECLCACSFYEYKKVDFYLHQGFDLLERPGLYGGHKYYRFEMKIS